MRVKFFLLLCFLSVVSVHSEVVNRSAHSYYTYVEMKEDLELLDSIYPDRVHLSVLGKTIDDRNIYELIVGDTLAPNAIYVHAAIHAREWMNTWVLMAIVEDYLKKWDSHYASGRTYGDILNHCCIHLIPMLNPDGVSISQFGLKGLHTDSIRNNVARMWGISDYRRWKSNANGVNLNVNFPYKWYRTSNNPGAGVYTGSDSASELETQCAIKALNTRDFKACISYHSTGSVVYWDLGQSGDLRASTYKLAKFVHSLTGYRLGETSKPRGLDYNYMNLQLKIPTVLIETGRHACPLSYKEFYCLYNENYKVLLSIANQNY